MRTPLPSNVSMGRSASSQRARELSCAPQRRQDAEVRSVRRS
jgi:hypothetical protein